MRKRVVLRSRCGPRVRELLGQHGLSVGDLAQRTSLPADRISDLLRGDLVDLTLRDMTIIADVLRTPLFGLLAPSDATVAVVPLKIVEERGSGDT